MIVPLSWILSKRIQKKKASIKTRFFKFYGADDGTRTRDLMITNQLLYQLSYTGAI